VVVPNVHVKVSVFERGPVVLSLQGAADYMMLKENDRATGSEIAVPGSLFAPFTTTSFADATVPR